MCQLLKKIYVKVGALILSTVKKLKIKIRGPFEKFVDWRQCAAVTQSKAVTVTPSCSGGSNVVVA
jgi:hypothetical protein